MSAIAGILYPESFPLSYAVGSALEALASRCPDPPTTYLYKNLELGTRGHPIGHNGRRTLSVALDGQITNCEELRAQLKKAGFRAEGLSPPGLLICAYEHWGDGLAHQLQGPFAIALFDQKKNELTLIRDRLGIRPLYWSYQNGTLLFASELKALLATGLIPQVIDEDAISSYLFLGYVPQDLAPIKGVNKLLPGCKLTLAPQGNLAVTTYWSYADYLSEDRPLEPGELISSLKAELRRQVPQGEVGYLAQGTMSNAALASQLPHGTALTTEYPGQNEEEVQAALAVSEALGQGMQTTSLTPATLLDSLPNIVWHLDEPLADPSVMGLWNLLQGESAKVCTDVGCAELLAAHPRYHDPKLAHLLAKPPPAANWGPLKKITLHLVHSITKPGLFHWLRKSHAHPWLAYFFGSEALFGPKMLRQLSPQIPTLFNPDIFITRIFQLSELGDTQNAFLFLDEKTKLPGKLLLPFDRLCSAAQKPWSAPFLSEGIAELMARVPNEQKLAPDPAQHPLYQLIDPSLHQAPFTPPQGRTFLNPYLNDATVKQAFDYLTKGTLVESGWLDRRWIKRALERHLPEPITFTQLWGLLHLEVWMRLFINTPVTTSPPDAPLFQVLQRG